MTALMRARRAELVKAYSLMGVPPEEAWRGLHPEDEATDDQAIRQILQDDDRCFHEARERERAMDPFPNLLSWRAPRPRRRPRRSAPVSTTMRRCAGFADRACSEEVAAPKKRCESCKRLVKQEHNRNYYQDHGQELSDKRRARRERQRRQRELELKQQEEEAKRLEEERKKDQKERLVRAAWSRILAEEARKRSLWPCDVRFDEEASEYYLQRN